MSLIPLRNILVRDLALYLAVPVVMSDQAAPEAEPPYVLYTVTTSAVPVSPFGDHVWRSSSNDTDTVADVRRDVLHATLSVTCVGHNRWTMSDPPAYISGDDEAYALAERAMAWFDHIGRPALADKDIVVVETMNAANRSGIVVDQAERRYGFDVRVRYGRVTERIDYALDGDAVTVRSH